MKREQILKAFFDDADPFAQYPEIPLANVQGMIRLFELMNLMDSPESKTLVEEIEEHGGRAYEC